ncbi:hypothetical protein BY458DRAFT_209567 [Sporodiniella umbellata]|nr:hypothetical protein BY458DRAFT_209567 [Sporodiniella umbellata]
MLQLFMNRENFKKQKFLYQKFLKGIFCTTFLPCIHDFKDYLAESKPAFLQLFIFLFFYFNFCYRILLNFIAIAVENLGSMTQQGYLMPL